MNKLQEKLDFLLDKYSVQSKAKFKDNRIVIIDQTELPLLPWRSERRFVELKNTVNNGTLVGISVMRVARIVDIGSDIYTELYRELDICQFVLQRKIKSIMVMQNENVLNAIAKAEDEVVCTIEISATLQNGELPKDKHEIIAQHGIACDVVVDAQLRQDSIYVFGEEDQKYTDVDFELYGLETEEISVVRAAFSLAQGKDRDQVKNADKNICVLVELAKKSAISGEREVL